MTPRVHKREEKRVSNCLKVVFEVRRSPDILLYSSYDNTLSSCSTKHMQVYLILQKQLLQPGIVELDTLPSLLSIFDGTGKDCQYVLNNAHDMLLVLYLLLTAT